MRRRHVQLRMGQPYPCHTAVGHAPNLRRVASLQLLLAWTGRRCSRNAVRLASSLQVGDAFTSSLYDIHIGLQGVPMLGAEWVLPKLAKGGLLNARSIMSTDVR